MTNKVERTITIAALPERVWAAWVNEMNAWWTKPYYNDHGRVTGLYMEPRLGGRYVEKWGEDGAGFLIGFITEWLPPLKLAYTWSQADWGGVVTLVRIEFQPDGEGGTRMTFVQEGFERLPNSAVMREGYDYGCNELMTRLKNYLERGRPA
jgi:uncharacterized protein YndB with AHSA1/START domain